MEELAVSKDFEYFVLKTDQLRYLAYNPRFIPFDEKENSREINYKRGICLVFFPFPKDFTLVQEHCSSVAWGGE